MPTAEFANQKKTGGQHTNHSTKGIESINKSSIPSRYADGQRCKPIRQGETWRP